MKAIFQIIVFVICAAALFGVGYFWGSSDTDKTLLKQVTEVVNKQSPIKLPIPTTTTTISTDENSVDLIKTLESMKNLDSWSLTQDHYFWSFSDNKWNPKLRSLRIEFKNGESYSFNNKTPDELMSLIKVIKAQHE
jgi:hypothetical protein